MWNALAWHKGNNKKLYPFVMINDKEEIYHALVWKSLEICEQNEQKGLCQKFSLLQNGIKYDGLETKYDGF